MLIKLLLRLWTFPNTLLGVFIGLLGMMSGGKFQQIRGCSEFHGGFVTWLLGRLPNNPMAMTLGHSIIGRTAKGLAIARDHEHVHVRQYERWGPFFVPAYLFISAVLWWKGDDPYRDNPFEIEAYSKEAIELPTFSDSDLDTNDVSDSNADSSSNADLGSNSDSRMNSDSISMDNSEPDDVGR